MPSSRSDIRENVSQARQAVIAAERAIQAARDEALLAVTSFDIAMRHQMDAAIDLIKRNGRGALTDEMVVEVIAHYFSKEHENDSYSEQDDYDNRRAITRAFMDALNDTHPWISLHARQGIVIEVTLPQDGDYAKALPPFLGDFFLALDQYVVNSHIGSSRRPVILFRDDQEHSVFIRAAKNRRLFSINPVQLELETPIGAQNFEEVVNMLPGLVRKCEAVTKERQKKPRWLGFPLAG